MGGAGLFSFPVVFGLFSSFPDTGEHLNLLSHLCGVASALFRRWGCFDERRVVATVRSLERFLRWQARRSSLMQALTQRKARRQTTVACVLNVGCFASPLLSVCGSIVWPWRSKLIQSEVGPKLD